MAALRATRPGEAAGQDPTVQVTAALPLDVGRHGAAIPVVFAAPAQIGLEVLLDHLIEHGIIRTPSAVGGGETFLRWFDGHVASLAGECEKAWKRKIYTI
jgi:hypothetical protein